MQRVDFYTSGFFPEGLMVAGGILAASGIVMLFVQILAGIVLIVGGLVTTSHYRLEVDPIKKLYREYVWFLGIKVGKPSRFETIEYFFIKTSRESQTMYSGRVASTTIRKQVFDG